ncbi:hypothetical protein [Microbulbifer mangrovi]|uniref:hypothetical protein n=1 Tax=Microbulbifer mangrovi TaxID=927787 RepID=UPI0009907D51|nr:hypothetical protein [Microbulbifer mangrovi]
MKLDQILILILGGGFIFLFVLLLINAIYIYLAYYPEISRKIDGETFNGGFLFAASRFMHWGHFCISRSRAQKFGVDDIFSELDRRARFHLVFHWGGMLTGVLLMLLGWCLLPENT